MAAQCKRRFLLSQVSPMAIPEGRSKSRFQASALTPLHYVGPQGGPAEPSCWSCSLTYRKKTKGKASQSFSVHSTPSFHPEASGALRLHPSSISNGKRPAQEPHVIRKSNWKGNLWPSGEPAPLSALGVGGAYLTQRHTQEADASILCGQ